ncbi:Phytanoyl-CoA dioxygenase (PhyH) [Novymonas esmeraldas]|uniref:Phytanoyl-CoA dioxygenase (PhyH) n=1 Tax=Novymonas esmeraldas TaxID=1808958 RepID=A0AAW0F740_9TRYP
MSSCQLTEADVREFAEAGVMVIRNVLTPEQVETLRCGVDRGYKCPSPRSKIASESSDTGKFFEDFRCWQDIPEYKEIIFNSALPRIAAELTGSRTIRLHHDHTLIKEPKTQQRTPWHQDTPYYNVDGKQTVSFWLPVDAVPEDSAMEFVRGSHNWPWMLPRTFKDNIAKWFPEGSLPETPDIEKLRSEMPIVSWALQPGDCYAFNFNTMHAAKGSRVLRRAMSVRYVGDDVTFAPRQWVTSPPFPELEKDTEKMVPGGPLVHSLFPIVYTNDVEA